jgi:hypothetical protein
MLAMDQHLLAGLEMPVGEGNTGSQHRQGDRAMIFGRQVQEC